MASRQERLPRDQIRHILAIGVALLSAPAFAQNWSRAAYPSASLPNIGETLAYSGGQSSVPTPLVVASARDAAVARLRLSTNDVAPTASSGHILQADLRSDAQAWTVGDRRDFSPAAETDSLPGSFTQIGLAGASATSLKDPTAALTSDAPGPYGKVSSIQPNATSLHIRGRQPFESSTASLVNGGPLAHTWQGIQAGMRANMRKLALCLAQNQTCSAAAQKLNRIIAEGRSHSGLARIGVINRAINLAIKPTSRDPYTWHSPLDTLVAGEGDCKDYAVAKYLALLAAGFAEQDVKLVIVHDMKVNQDHAIVAVHFDGDWIVLDNRWLALVRDVEIRRAIPLYVLDGDGVSRFSRQQAQANPPAPAGFTAGETPAMYHGGNWKIAEDIRPPRHAGRRR